MAWSSSCAGPQSKRRSALARCLFAWFPRPALARTVPVATTWFKGKQAKSSQVPGAGSTWWGAVTWFRPQTMRVALKLVLATVLGTLAVLIIFGWVRARREVELFDSDMRRDHLLVGT